MSLRIKLLKIIFVIRLFELESLNFVGFGTVSCTLEYPEVDNLFLFFIANSILRTVINQKSF